jgi:hypothetical protein
VVWVRYNLPMGASMETILTKIVEVAFAKAAFPSAVAFILLIWFLKEWSRMKQREDKLAQAVEALTEGVSKATNILQELTRKPTKSHKTPQKATQRGGKRK